MSDQCDQAALDHRTPGRAHAPASAERRGDPRVSIEVEVSFSSASQFFVGLTGDMSEGGLFVSTYRSLPVGAEISLALSLPDGPLFARGQVRWVRDSAEGVTPGVGVAFEALAHSDRVRIQAFCAARPPWYYDVAAP
jgi:uncharacterized protein (TIGR02266 family)